jgi:hypothetical protein
VNGYQLVRSALVGAVLCSIGMAPALADMTADEAPARIDTEAEITLGYRGTSVHGQPGRALEYDSLESGPLFKTRLFTDQGSYHLDLGVDYLNDKDYSAAARLDTLELLHLDLRTERFYHNLDHIPYIGEGSRPAATAPDPEIEPWVHYNDENPGDRYGLRLDMSEARLKLKSPDYPAHLTFAYWRYEKQGAQQLRYVDENCATACHMQSKRRSIDRVTEEVKIGADAHAGFLDLAIETLMRTFRSREHTPQSNFGIHDYGRPAGSYQHDAVPDSKLTELTLRANTAPSGGLVGSANFTLGKRENQSDGGSVVPVKAETDYLKTSADATYTPSENWTFNFRYRLLDMDSSNSNYLSSYDSLNTNPLAVRDSVDLTRSWYEALVNYRPSKRLTIKAEWRREEIDRSDTGPLVEHHSQSPEVGPITINPNWQLPDEEVITRAKLGFHSRWLERSALKVSGWAALQHNSDPAYGTSFSTSRELFLAASYTHGPLWGLTANLNFLDEENDDFTIYQSSYGRPDQFDLDRTRRQQNASLGAWLTPLPGLSFDLNYGYLRTAIDQDLIFGAGLNLSNPEISYAIADPSVDYRQTVQTLAAGVSWQATERLACRLEGYHIRSKASYSPNFPTSSFPYYFGNVPGDASSADLRAISKLDLRQNGVRGRVSWQFDEHWSTAVEGTYNDYDEVGNDVFDGSVQTCMVSLSRRW